MRTLQKSLIHILIAALFAILFFAVVPQKTQAWNCAWALNCDSAPTCDDANASDDSFTACQSKLYCADGSIKNSPQDGDCTVQVNYRFYSCFNNADQGQLCGVDANGACITQCNPSAGNTGYSCPDGITGNYGPEVHRAIKKHAGWTSCNPPVATNTPVPPTNTPAPTTPPGCTGCSNTGNCANLCPNQSCGVDSCGNACRWGTKNCTPTATPTPAACQGCGNYDSPPASGATLTIGSTQTLWGWDYFTSGPAGRGTTSYVDQYLCDPVTFANCKYIDPATHPTTRNDTIGTSCAGSSVTTGNNGWQYTWTAGQVWNAALTAKVFVAAGNYGLMTIPINNPNTPYCTLSFTKNITLVGATPTPTRPPVATATPTRGATPTPTPNAALSVVLTANPSSGNAPLNGVDLTATVTGGVTSIRYRYDCTNDGTFESDVTDSTAPLTPNTATNLCNYPTQGTYTAFVRVNSNSLTATDTVTINVSAPLATPTPTAIPTTTLQGTVIDDPFFTAGIAGSKCTSGVATTGIDPNNSNVRVNPDGLTGNVAANGTYSIAGVTNIDSPTKTITLNNLGAYVCSCPSNCDYNSIQLRTNGAAGWNFYVASALPKWAQILSGALHAQSGGTISVPSTSYLIDNVSSISSMGSSATRNAGQAFNANPGGIRNPVANWNLSETISGATWRYSYQQLYENAGRPGTDPGNGSNPPGGKTGNGIWYKNADFTISGDWTGLTNSKVIFVNGNVTINQPITFANNSAFFAIIASGNIAVSNSVGGGATVRTESTVNPLSDSDLAGLYLANGNFDTGTTGASNDEQLIIYGTIGANINLDGTGNVRFQRNMGINNNTGPGTMVIWNPNLLLNVPNELRDTITNWKEVAN